MRKPLLTFILSLIALNSATFCTDQEIELKLINHMKNSKDNCLNIKISLTIQYQLGEENQFITDTLNTSEKRWASYFFDQTDDLITNVEFKIIEYKKTC